MQIASGKVVGGRVEEIWPKVEAGRSRMFPSIETRFSASDVLMSGLGAPLRTATPMPERTSGVRVVPSSLPCLMRSSIPAVVRMVESRASPASIRAFNRAAAPHTKTSLCWVAFSNCGASSSSTDFSAFELTSLISAALAGGPNPFPIPADHFKFVVFKNPNWDFKTLDFDKDVELADQRDGGLINAIDPNLKPFVTRGGKLIIWHGWNDQLIAPRNAINYYKSVIPVLGGAAKTADSVRLFMAPGVNHCFGGDGPSQNDLIANEPDAVRGFGLLNTTQVRIEKA